MDVDLIESKNLIDLFINCQNPLLVNEAQQKLSEWEKEPLFYTNLLALFQDQTIGELKFRLSNFLP